MSKPYIHAKSSARRYGGKPEDYMDIHEFFDSSKAALADVRHRVVLHSAFGIFLVEKMFGSTRVNSDNKTYSVRDIGEQHVMEDLGFIPSLEQWMRGAEIEPWMMGKGSKPAKEPTLIPFEPAVKPVSPGVSVWEQDGSYKLPTTFAPKPADTFIDGIGNRPWNEVIVKD